MKFIFFTFFFIFSLVCQAQKNTSLLSVRYRFSHIKDTTKPEVVYTENMQLFVAATISMYKSADKVMLDSIKEAKLDEQIKTQTGNLNFNIDLSGIKSADATIYYKNELTKTLSVLQKLGQEYIIESTLPSINWTIASETKTIENYTCQKATTIFKGRHYVAWFCPDLPYSNGPWKLGGLPGLILEAYDPNGTVKFLFDAITKTELPIELPKKAIRTTREEYKRLLDLKEKDPEAFLRSQIGNINMGSLKVEIKDIKIDNSKRVEPIINNPLELSKD